MSQLLPYETIVKASEGDPDAVAAVLSHYAGYIRACSKMDGQINTDMSAAMTRTRPADRTLRFIILLLARWTCPNNRPTYPTQCASAG